MPVTAPAAPSFAPEERPVSGPAWAPKEAPKADRSRTGQHETLRSSGTRLAVRGTALGITVAAGAAGAGYWLQHDLEAGLLAGAQLGSVAATMAFVGGWAERRRLGRVARRISDLAIRLAAEEIPERQALPRLLAVNKVGAPELVAATRRTLEQQPDARGAVRLLGRVALIRTLL
jgi:hypothetical protein